MASVRIRKDGSIAFDGMLSAREFDAYRVVTSTLATWNKEAGRLKCWPRRAKEIKRRLLDEGVACTIEDEKRDEPKRSPKTVGAKHELFAHQVAGAQWLIDRDQVGGLLLDDMGLGKTVQVLASLKGGLGILPEGACAIIVCPATLKAVRKREVAILRADLECSVSNGAKHIGDTDLADVRIFNYENLNSQIVVNRNTTLVFDECHFAKSPKSKRTKEAMALADRVGEAGGVVYGLTGTPILSSPWDLWNILKLLRLEKEAYGGYDGFLDAFGGEFVITHTGKGPVKHVEFGTPTERAKDVSKVSLRRLKKDALDLPAKVFTVVPVMIPPAICKKIDSLALEFETISEAKAMLAKAKFALTEAYVSEVFEGVSVVVATDHLVDTGWPFLKGDVPQAERFRMVNAFQDGAIDRLVLTHRVGGVGITLTKAASVVFNDLSWTPAENEQVEDRCLRIGQHECVTIHLVVSQSALDRAIHNKLVAKRGLVSATVSTDYSARIAANLDRVL